MAAQTILILVVCGIHDAAAVRSTNSHNTGLRWANKRRRRETQTDLLAGVRIVAIDTCRMAVVIQNLGLMGRMGAVCSGCGRGMTDLWQTQFRVNIGSWRRDVRPTVVAGQAILVVRLAEQRFRRVVSCVAG